MPIPPLCSEPKTSRAGARGRSDLLRRLAAGLCSTLLAAPSLGQAPVPAPGRAPTQAQQAPPLRVTTHLVQVNVIVQDKKGEPVADLTRDDFTLLDQGQPQEINSFSIESLRTMPAPAEPPRANLYSDRLERKAGTPTSGTAILLDGLNTRFEDMAYARMQIIKFLGQLQPQDHVALYALTTNLRVLHDFTTDATSLLRAIQLHKGQVSSELAASEPKQANSGIDEIDEFLNSANQHIADFYTISRARQTANTLEDIANHLARLPGRKQRQALLQEAVHSPLDATSLGLNVSVTPVDVPGARTLKTELQISSRDVTFDAEGDRWVGALDLLFLQLAADGSAVTGENKTVNMRLMRATYDEVMKKGVILTRNVRIATGAVKLRVVVRDATSGAIG